MTIPPTRCEQKSMPCALLPATILCPWGEPALGGSPLCGQERSNMEKEAKSLITSGFLDKPVVWTGIRRNYGSPRLSQQSRDGHSVCKIFKLQRVRLERTVVHWTNRPSYKHDLVFIHKECLVIINFWCDRICRSGPRPHWDGTDDGIAVYEVWWDITSF